MIFDGKKLQKIREDQGITKYVLAKSMGLVNQISVDRYESGKAVPGGKMLGKLARVLGVKVDDFYSEID